MGDMLRDERHASKYKTRFRRCNQKFYKHALEHILDMLFYRGPNKQKEPTFMSSSCKKPILIPMDPLMRMTLNAEAAWRQRETPDSVVHRTGLVREALDLWFQVQARMRERQGHPANVFDAMNMKVELPAELPR